MGQTSLGKPESELRNTSICAWRAACPLNVPVTNRVSMSKVPVESVEFDREALSVRYRLGTYLLSQLGYLFQPQTVFDEC
jgi:hypothetical protein